MRSSAVSSINRLVNSVQWKHAVVLLGEPRQIGWLCLQPGAERAISLSIVAVACRAICQVFRLARIKILRPAGRIHSDYHTDDQRPASSSLHHNPERVTGKMSLRPTLTKPTPSQSGNDLVADATNKVIDSILTTHADVAGLNASRNLRPRRISRRLPRSKKHRWNRQITKTRTWCEQPFCLE